jgi:hypothetical protein
MVYSRRLGTRTLISTVVALMFLLLAAGVASAHEKRAAGDDTIFVGFASEPAVVEQPNAVDLLVRKGDSEDAQPVTGLADSLKADVKFGNQTTTLSFEESDENPGEYLASFIPTAEGPYTFRIYGTINGANVDESFTSGPDTFSAVESSTSLQFPSKVPPVGSVADTASAAHDTASSARTLGIIGIIVGLLGLAAGIAGMMMARGSRQGAAATKRSVMGQEVQGPAARP